MRSPRKLAVAAVLAAASLAAAADAATLVPVGGFERPIHLTSDPSDPDRLFVVEREGRVLEVRSGAVSLFGDLEPLVSCCTSERGLLSIALAPDFASSRRFYAAYTGTPAAGGAEGDIHLDAFRPSPAGGGQLLREPILSVPHAANPNHNGGQLQLGPDGYLYLSTGDGGGAGDPGGNAQDRDSLLGKLLRIEPRPGQSPSYVSPPGNPFVAAPGRDEIWAYGLRNPWRFSFDRASGDLLVADVGQGEREEVNHAPSPGAASVGGAGANYGWNCREGLLPYGGANAPGPGECDSLAPFADPAFDYPHEDPEDGGAHGCSITGGYVVRDPGLDDLYGRYLYADFCVGEIRSLLPPAASGAAATDDRSEGLHVANPVSFGEDSCGRLYVVSNGGAVYRIEGEQPSDCPPPSPPSAPPGAAPRAPAAPAGPGIAAPGRRSLRPAASQVRVLLRAGRRRGGRVRLTVRVRPCGVNAGRAVRLNRGGKRLRRKRLNERCVARFGVRVGRRAATFRAVFGAQRSQVRTIALAKPSP